MADQPTIFELKSLPGVRRDGTDLANMFYQDAQWVRFQRGQPRKMGGYSLIDALLAGPVRDVFVDARASGYSAHLCSPRGVDKVLFATDGASGGITTRLSTAVPGFTENTNYLWQSTFMTQSGGSGTPTYIACATPDADNLASDLTGTIWSGDVAASTALAQVQDGSGPIAVSGGVAVLQPFLFVFGSNGLIRNSNANDISSGSGWTTGGSNYANSANPCGSKVVAGLPMRGGGQSPAGVFWALDSVIRVSFTGGAAIWRYDVLSEASSILSKKCVVEYDNVYYWPGVDRFYMYNGTVQELPNDMNLNWFYDNVNPEQRQKVWAWKVPRYGEIWWFFPYGTSTECNAAVIYNVREKTWYDALLVRTAGAPARVHPRPVACGELETYLTLGYMMDPSMLLVNQGETVTGGTTGATARILRNNVTAGELVVTDVSGIFSAGEGFTTSGGGASTFNTAIEQQYTKLWMHETGTDRVEDSTATAIEAYCETTNFQWMSGGPPDGQPGGPNLQTRLLRVEPDFIMSGQMTVQATGRSYAQSAKQLGVEHTFDANTEFIDMREQHREIALKFTCNAQGADFQMGRIFLTAEPGDARG